MKTNFQNGTIVTPTFLNAINSPVWKQAPANDGEIKPPALTDMPDVEDAIAGMAQTIPDVCTIDLTACVAVGANGTDVLLSSLLDMPNSRAFIRPASNYNFYALDLLLKFSATVGGSPFRVKIPDVAFQNRPWLTAFLAGSKQWIHSLQIHPVIGFKVDSHLGILMVDGSELNVYASGMTATWADVVPRASSVLIRGQIFW